MNVKLTTKGDKDITSWARDISKYVVENIIHEFKDRYIILHIRREDQPQYENTYHIQDTFRALAALMFFIISTT